MKTCFKCGESKVRTEFYKHPKMKDGLLGKCKVCTKKDSTQNRKDNVELRREYDRQRAYEPSRIIARKEYAASERGKERKALGASLWRKRNKTKARAHSAVARAIAAGKIAKKNCDVCGENRTQAHHDDYAKPLEIRWLCSCCHSRHHTLQRAAVREGASL